ncbi:Ankyrin repeat domain-containing protein 1 [Hondaea fermentalgiana]|uniref:Ankyrin repeat domain-containing protein 1 n=1 Tax=Hondaea fermentalgiana TaxID=2315210 RepID=A0A2R5GTN1_9STRA|nr:Ankyrin repeat domain-containing protein 1 [Hondaea fermentalgiana]|eukprot:GBG31244.1 Ankyrin repeat domain-containing protein 1 [Hondaea fermentalgiana]
MLRNSSSFVARFFLLVSSTSLIRLAKFVRNFSFIAEMSASLAVDTNAEASPRCNPVKRNEFWTAGKAERDDDRLEAELGLTAAEYLETSASEVATAIPISCPDGELIDPFRHRLPLVDSAMRALPRNERGQNFGCPEASGFAFARLDFRTLSLTFCPAEGICADTNPYWNSHEGNLTELPKYFFFGDPVYAVYIGNASVPALYNASTSLLETYKTANKLYYLKDVGEKFSGANPCQNLSPSWEASCPLVSYVDIYSRSIVHHPVLRLAKFLSDFAKFTGSSCSAHTLPHWRPLAVDAVTESAAAAASGSEADVEAKSALTVCPHLTPMPQELEPLMTADPVQGPDPAGAAETAATETAATRRRTRSKMQHKAFGEPQELDAEMERGEEAAAGAAARRGSPRRTKAAAAGGKSGGKKTQKREKRMKKVSSSVVDCEDEFIPGDAPARRSDAKQSTARSGIEACPQEEDEECRVVDEEDSPGLRSLNNCSYDDSDDETLINDEATDDGEIEIDDSNDDAERNDDSIQAIETSSMPDLGYLDIEVSRSTRKRARGSKKSKWTSSKSDNDPHEVHESEPTSMHSTDVPDIHVASEEEDRDDAELVHDISISNLG